MINTKAPRAFLESAFRLYIAERNRNLYKPWLPKLGNIKIRAVFSEPASISVNATLPMRSVDENGIKRWYSHDWIGSGENLAPVDDLLSATLTHKYFGLTVFNNSGSSNIGVYVVNLPALWAVEPLPPPPAATVTETTVYPWNIIVSEPNEGGIVEVSALLPLEWAVSPSGRVNFQTTDDIL
jgi:hypothetical protein